MQAFLPKAKAKKIKGFLYVEPIFNNASSQQHRPKRGEHQVTPPTPGQHG